MQETARQIAALEAMRAEQSARIFASRAETGGGLVLLRNLQSQPHLNGTIARIVASCAAPRRPSAGRMAVRLDDDSIISVRFENALPEVPVGTRIAVGSGCTMSRGGGFKVDASFGSIIEVREGGFRVVVRVDAVYDSLCEGARRPASAAESAGSLVTLQPWDKNALILEADCCKLAELIRKASGFERPFALAISAGSSRDECEAARDELRAAETAAGRWVALENQANMIKLAALTRLQILRRLAYAHAACPGHQPPLLDCQAAWALCDKADALRADHAEWFEAFPAPLTKPLYAECAHTCLVRAHLLLEHDAPFMQATPHLYNAVRDGSAKAAAKAARHEQIMSLLGHAEQYARETFADDEALQYTTFEKRVLCLVDFHSPQDTVSFAPARAGSHRHDGGSLAGRAAHAPSDLPARRVGEIYLEQLASADAELRARIQEGEARVDDEASTATRAGEALDDGMGFTHPTPNDGDGSPAQGAAVAPPPHPTAPPRGRSSPPPWPPLGRLDGLHQGGTAVERWRSHREGLEEAKRRLLNWMEPFPDTRLLNWLERFPRYEDHADVCEPCR